MKIGGISYYQKVDKRTNSNNENLEFNLQLKDSKNGNKEEALSNILITEKKKNSAETAGLDALIVALPHDCNEE